MTNENTPQPIIPPELQPLCDELLANIRANHPNSAAIERRIRYLEQNPDELLNLITPTLDISAANVEQNPNPNQRRKPRVVTFELYETDVGKFEKEIMNQIVEGILSDDDSSESRLRNGNIARGRKLT